MASRTANRPLQSIIRRIRPCECANATASRTASLRRITASTKRPEASQQEDPAERPRWSYTPEEMKAPFPWKPKNPEKTFEVNSDPKRLDRFYINFFGQGGESVLTDEIKWLAITHKSFDQGRRGFNDRLAFFGRRILNLQTNTALVHSQLAPGLNGEGSAVDGREPFRHPALEGLPNLAATPLGDILTKERLSQLATQLGMRDIIRWQPRKVTNLESSGIDVVLTSCLYAIVGAVALQKGGAVAGEVAREKILKPLGIS